MDIIVSNAQHCRNEEISIESTSTLLKNVLGNSIVDKIPQMNAQLAAMNHMLSNLTMRVCKTD